jgi:hypothetical protein
LNSWNHAQSCAKKWGGKPEDYLAVHEFIDSSKKVIGDARHRSIYHHTMGVWLAQDIFGRVLEVKRDIGSVYVPVRLIAERHILEDLGWLPSPKDYIDAMNLRPWMSGAKLRDQSLASLGLTAPVRGDQ